MYETIILAQIAMNIINFPKQMDNITRARGRNS